MALCWMCNKNIATTGEHRQKNSLNKKLNPNQKKIYIQKENGKRAIIQGPDSIHLKHEKNLCSNCNNSFSQPFDHAYDLFIDYLLNNEQEIFLNKRIGLKFLNYEERINLFKYFIKSFGCVVNEAYLVENSNIPVPSELISFLYGASLNNKFSIRFFLRKNSAFTPFKQNNCIQLLRNIESFSFVESDASSSLLFTYTESIGWLSCQYLFMNQATKYKRKEFLERYFPRYWNERISPIIINEDDVINFKLLIDNNIRGKLIHSIFHQDN